MIYNYEQRIVQNMVMGHIHEPCILLNTEVISIHPTARIDSFCKIEGGRGVEIQEFVHIASFSHINVGGGEVLFGAHSGCSSGVRICSGMPDFTSLYISAAEVDNKWFPLRLKTVIGKYVVIFANAVICPGVEIGEGAIIGAGSVVLEDVPPWEIWAGVPAKKIGRRAIA